MQVLNTILLILLFILCLSILIVVHELGHFAAAKFFNVYCKEFSIGFGPAFFHKKRQKGETYFSLRCIPFGGYVSMYGEGVELEPGENIDPSRSYTSIKKWKRCIILFAGVFNNAILAIILFLIANTCCIQKAMYLSYVSVGSGSYAESIGINDKSYIKVRTTNDDSSLALHNLDINGLAYYDDGSSEQVAVTITTNGVTYKTRNYDDYIGIYKVGSDGKVLVSENNKILPIQDNLISVNFDITTCYGEFYEYKDNNWDLIPYEAPADPKLNDKYVSLNNVVYNYNGEKWVEVNDYRMSYMSPESPKNNDVWYNTESISINHEVNLSPTLVDNKVKFTPLGISFYLEEYWNSFGEGFKNTFRDFGESASLIYRSLASLFTSTSSWQNVGGIVAIGVQTSNILQNMGIGRFLYIWGVISVNLAIVNLLPFPGLDGWQILVLIVEGVAHKDIPDKVKGWISTIGIALLFALMIIILVKDVIGLF